MERGDFDDLPGAGKPIEDLGEHHDPNWWLKKLVEREHVAVLPPSLALRKEDAELDGILDKLNTEGDVRRHVKDFNERVVAARYRTARGPAADHHAPRRRRDGRGLARAAYGAPGRAAPQGPRGAGRAASSRAQAALVPSRRSAVPRRVTRRAGPS